MLELITNVADIISKIIDNEIIFGLLILAAVFLGENRWPKRKKILTALILAAIAGYGLKHAFAINRPCMIFDSKVPCPSDYSFPSMHATLAFALVLPFINKKSYPLFLLFATITAFTRVYLGVHTIEDISAGLIVAAISYYVVDRVMPILATKNGEGEK